MKDYIIINPIDNVAVVLRPFSKGEVVEGVTLLEDIPQAHKVALKDIKSGEDVIKYAHYIEEAMKKGIPNIIAHPDLYMLEKSSFWESCEEAALIICKAAEKYQIPLEINLTRAA